MAPLKVLVCGGGVAGLTLAYWLGRAPECFDITVVERTSDLRASGQQIDIRGQGLTVMRRMGLEDAVRAHTVDEEGLQFVNDAGRPMAVFRANKTGHGKQSFTAEFEIMRGDLIKVLYEAARDKARYIFGVYVTSLEQRVRADGEAVVDVVFSDGAKDTFDLVVGADGQSSRTRRMAFGKDEELLHPLGVAMALFTIPRKESDTNLAAVYHIPKGRLIMTRTDNPRTTQAYLCLYKSHPKAQELERITSNRVDIRDQKKVWAELFSDASWQTGRILDAMLNDPLADDFYVQKVAQVKMKAWWKGRVVLLGDAGYCPTVLTGLGTSSAMVGAYLLAGELTSHANRDGGMDVDKALAAYDQRLRPLMDEAMKLAPGIPGMVYPASRWGIWLLQTILWLAATLRLDKLGQALGSDDIQAGSWQLPNYPELARD